MTLAEELDKIAEDTKGGNTLKTAELVNLTFTIHGFEVKDQEKDGKPVLDSYGKQKTFIIGEIMLDGEPHEAYLDGVTVRPQLLKLKEADALPAKVKLVQVEKRYQLKLLASAGELDPEPFA